MIINLRDRERDEAEILILASALNDAAERGAPAAHYIAKLARRIAETAGKLTTKDA